MIVATSMFGPFDVCTIREIVEHIEEFDEGETIYVKDERPLEPDTLAAVTNGSVTAQELEQELGFRCLGEVDLAREVVQDYGQCKSDARFRELLRAIEEWCM